MKWSESENRNSIINNLNLIIQCTCTMDKENLTTGDWNCAPSKEYDQVLEQYGVVSKYDIIG